MRVAVVGLGKIGLPLAVQFASKGAETVGCDIDANVVNLVNSGLPPFPGEAGLDEMLPKLVSDGLLTATSDTAQAVGEVDVVVVVVPLLVDESRSPEFDFIDAATRSIAAGLRRGHLVIYETTVPVGTTRNRFGQALGELSGLEPGAGFSLAYSPERVFSGRILQDLRRYPKLVGGIDDASAKAAVSFYESVLDFDPRPDLDRDNGVWDLGSAEAAELAKLAETTYRDINIAFANELATYAEQVGIDIVPLIEASNSQPFSHIHQPGLVGGHCIPVYPYFYLEGDSNARLPRVAREINESVAGRIVRRIEDELGDFSGLRMAVLGATYRGGVKETAFSGVFPLVEAILAAGGIPVVHDPLLSGDELIERKLEPYRLGEPCDVAIVQIDDERYRKLTPDDVPGCRLLVDLRRVVAAGSWAGTASVVYLGSWDRRKT